MLLLLLLLLCGVCVCDTGKNQFFFEKFFRGKFSKLIVSYHVLIKKSSFLGHFCVTDRQTYGRKVGVTELHIAAKNFEKKVNHGRPRRYYILGVILFSKKKSLVS